MRVRDRPRKRRAPQGHLSRVVATGPGSGRRLGAPDLHRRPGADRGVRAGCRRPGGVVRRRRRPHRTLRRTGAGSRVVAASSAGVACAEYAPARVKQSVCGYGRADKEQVGRMVQAILGLEEVPTPNHAADALAVAICHALAPPLLRTSLKVGPILMVLSVAPSPPPPPPKPPPPPPPTPLPPPLSAPSSRLSPSSLPPHDRAAVRPQRGPSRPRRHRRCHRCRLLVHATPSVQRLGKGEVTVEVHTVVREERSSSTASRFRRARAVRAAARGLRRRPEGRARDRLRLDAGGASSGDRPRRRQAVPGDPRGRPEDRAARRARAEGEAVGRRPRARPDERRVTARDALVELGWRWSTPSGRSRGRARRSRSRNRSGTALQAGRMTYRSSHRSWTTSRKRSSARCVRARSGRVRRAVARQGAARDRPRSGEGPRRGARPRAARRPTRSWQDVPRADRA